MTTRRKVSEGFLMRTLRRFKSLLVFLGLFYTGVITGAIIVVIVTFARQVYEEYEYAKSLPAEYRQLYDSCKKYETRQGMCKYWIENVRQQDAEAKKDLESDKADEEATNKTSKADI